MTKGEMVGKFLAWYGYHLVGGGEAGENLELIHPWLMMDLQKTMFDRHVKKVECRHELVKLRNEWNQSYTRINDKLYKPYTDEEKGEVIEQMDALEAYLNNDMVRLRLAVMQQMPEAGREDKDIVSGAYLCMVLTLIARSVYKKQYRRLKPRTRWEAQQGIGRVLTTEETPELDAIVDRSSKWITAYIRQRRLAPVMMNDNITQLQETLCRKSVRWIFEK